MLSEYETYLLDKIDSRVEHATDDELFAGGYLQGHITLAIAELEQENNTQLSALKSRVEESIQKLSKQESFLLLIKYWFYRRGMV